MFVYSRAQQYSVRKGILGILFALIIIGGHAAANESGSNLEKIGIWRRPEFDAANCLYLQLHLLGYQGTYERFLSDLPAVPKSLADISSASTSLGYKLQPRSIGPADLAAIKEPAIILFEPEGLHSAQYCILLDHDSKRVRLVYGGPMVWKEMPTDAFLRGWSGFILVPDQRQWAMKPFMRTFAGVALFLLVCLTVSNVRAKQNHSLG